MKSKGVTYKLDRVVTFKQVKTRESNMEWRI